MQPRTTVGASGLFPKGRPWSPEGKDRARPENTLHPSHVSPAVVQSCCGRAIFVSYILPRSQMECSFIFSLKDTPFIIFPYVYYWHYYRCPLSPPPRSPPSKQSLLQQAASVLLLCLLCGQSSECTQRSHSENILWEQGASFTDAGPWPSCSLRIAFRWHQPETGRECRTRRKYSELHAVLRRLPIAFNWHYSQKPISFSWGVQ